MNPSSSPLSEIPPLGFLSEVSQEHRSFIRSFGKFLRPGDGEVVITEGKPQDTLNLIFSGTLHVTSTSGDRPILIARLSEGDSFGEINLFDPATASANVISRGNSIIWSINRDEMDVLFEADPAAGVSIMKGLLRHLSGQFRRMNDKLASSEQKASIHAYWNSKTS
jgi:CRP-like cAMP-binding protein